MPVQITKFTGSAATATGSEPDDLGLIGWSSDPACIAAGAGLTAGRAAVVWVPVRDGGLTITRLHVVVATAGVTLTVSGLAMYSLAGNLLSNAPLSGTAYQTAAAITGTLTTPQTPASGENGVYVAMWAVGTTQPQMARNGTNFPGVNLTGPSVTRVRHGQSPASSFTTGTPPGTLGTVSTNFAFVAAVS